MAETDLQKIFEDETIAPDIRDEAKSDYELLESSKVYYRWLDRLTVSIRSGEIFKLLPKYLENDK